MADERETKYGGQDVIVIRSKDGKHDLVLRPRVIHGVRVYVAPIPGLSQKKPKRGR